jgi:PKD repeat protein
VDAPGDYELTVDDIVTGCNIENEVAVTSQIDPPVASAGEDTPISCENLQLTLSGTGNAGYTVTWTTVNGHILSGANTYNPIVDAPGDYAMTVLNPANSCTTTDAAIVINNLQPAVAQYNFQTSGLTMIGNDQSTGSNVSGWNWNFGDGNSSNEPNAVHTFAAPGVFQVCLSVQNGCGVNQVCQMVEVSFVGSVLSVNSEITDVLCFGDSTGNVVLTVNGGSGVYTYQWSGPEGASYSTPDLQNVVAGVYQLVITDDVGNIFIGEYTVNQPAPIVLAGSAIADNPCFGDLNGSISIDVDGGVGPFSYSFNGGASQQDSFLLNQASGDFVCQVTDANGCQFLTAPFTIAQPADLSYQSIQTNVRCFGESNGAINLQVSGGVSPYSYLWSTGENAATELTNLVAGQYTCLVTDLHGCTDNLLYTVTQPDLLQSTNIQVINATGPTQNNGSITIEPIGGTAPYAISWNTGATGNKIENLLPGEYTYSIIDALGCTFNPAGPVTVGISTSTTHIEWSSNISITPNPSNGNVVIKWHDVSVVKGSITLLTLEGKKISDRLMESGSGYWDLSAIGLDGGVYLVLFQINEQSVPFKLVVVD